MYIFFLYVIYIHIQNIATSNPHKTKEKEKRGRKKTHRLQFFYSIALAIIHKDMLTR